MRRFRFVRLAAFTLVLVIGPGLGVATAQSTGTVNGTVSDNTGAILPGVTVTVTGPAVMGTQTAVTNDQGQYRFPALPLAPTASSINSPDSPPSYVRASSSAWALRRPSACSSRSQRSTKR
ncbi:MAG: carboxypeptidase-like regulatory domain-containing protein [Acidobacteriota bacterium]